MIDANEFIIDKAIQFDFAIRHTRTKKPIPLFGMGFFNGLLFCHNA